MTSEDIKHQLIIKHGVLATSETLTQTLIYASIIKATVKDPTLNNCYILRPGASWPRCPHAYLSVMWSSWPVSYDDQVCWSSPFCSFTGIFVNPAENSWQTVQFPLKMPQFELIWQTVQFPLKMPQFELSWQTVLFPTEMPQFKNSWQTVLFPTETPHFEPSWQTVLFPTVIPQFELSWQTVLFSTETPQFAQWQKGSN